MRTETACFSRLHARVLFAVLAAIVACAIVETPANAASYAGIVMDAKTGKILYSHREDARQAPASLTKMMTLYMLFEAMESGRVSKKTRISISRHAAGMPPSKLGVKAGGSVTVEQAILALVTKSANDVASAVGEHIAGSESKFSQSMTAKARSLGMKSTTFKNASGLPNSGQLTTAHDMAVLGIALREHFPRYYGYFSTRVFTYGKKRMGNHNRLLGRVKGMDGIKTGYTKASGFNLVSSVERDGGSIVAVVLGGKSGKARNDQMAALVKRYMPKASHGGDSLVVAKAKTRKIVENDVVTASASQPRTAKSMLAAFMAPVPSKRPAMLEPQAEETASLRVATAHIVSSASQEGGSENGAGFDIAAIEQKLRQMSGHKLPVPSPAPASGQIDPIVTAETSSQDIAGELAYMPEQAEPETKASGWQIQIGAAPSLGAATKLLENARAKAPAMLEQVANHTETVAKGNTMLYRARFAGFASKDDAWAACGQLKKKKFACIALSN